MGTTDDTLQTADAVRLAFVCLFEGLSEVWVSELDADPTTGVSRVKTAWAGTQHGTGNWHEGLALGGQTNSRVNLFDPDLDPQTMTITITDADGAVGTTFLAPARAPGNIAYLTADLSPDATAIDVKSSSSWPVIGYGHIGLENVYYTHATSIPSPRFTGVQRAQLSLTARSNGQAYAGPHMIDRDSGSAPRMSTYPRTHYGRFIQLYATHWFIDESTYAYRWAKPSEAKLIFSGRVEQYTDNGNGTMSFVCRDITSYLDRAKIMDQQYKAKLAEGLDVTSSMNALVLKEAYSDDLYETTFTADHYTHDSLAQVLNNELTASGGSTLSLDWTFGLTSDNRYRLTGALDATDATPTGVNAVSASKILLNKDVATLLGFDVSNEQPVHRVINNVDYELVEMDIPRKQSSGAGPAREPWELTAKDRPILIYDGFDITLVNGQLAIAIDLDDETGTFQPQPKIPQGFGISSSVNGFLQIGGEIVPVFHDGSSTVSCFFGSGDYKTHLAKYGAQNTQSFGAKVGLQGHIRLGDLNISTDDVKQVWWERSDGDEQFLRFMLSTGVSGYNHPEYDLNPRDMGVGIPASLIDIPSFQSLGQVTQDFLITEPTALWPIIQSALAIRNKYLVIRSGKMRVVGTSLDNAAYLGSDHLTENNKSSPNDIPQTEYGGDGIINRVDLQYNRQIDGKYLNTIQVNDMPSVTDHGQRRTIKIAGWTVRDDNLSVVVDNLIAPALAYFSRPLAVTSRSIDFSMSHLVPSDVVQVTDQYITDPRTGTRGVTAMAAWVRAVSFDWSTLRGTVDLVFVPDLDTARLGIWAPATTIVASNAGGTVLTVSASRYSYLADTDTYDMDFFAVGDEVRILERGPANPASHIDTQTAITAIDRAAQTITVSPGEAALQAALAANRYFDLVYDTITSPVDTGQKAKSFIADDATNGTGDAADDAYLYGDLSTNVDFSERRTIPVNGGTGMFRDNFERFPNVVDDTARPMSVNLFHNLAFNLNSLLSNRTSPIILNEVTPSGFAISQTGTTFKLAYGPVYIPLYGYKRDIMVRVLGATGVFRVYASHKIVRGTTETTTVYPGIGTTSVDITIPGSATWSNEEPLSLSPPFGLFVSAVWLTVEVRGLDSSGTGSFVGISAREREL